MKALKTIGLMASTLTLAVALTAASAYAQQPAPTAPAKAPAATTTKKETKEAKKAPSACKGLDQAACSANSACTYIAATKSKKGKEIKAYCRSKPTSTKAKAADAKTAPAPAPTAPAAKTDTKAPAKKN